MFQQLPICLLFLLRNLHFQFLIGIRKRLCSNLFQRFGLDRYTFKLTVAEERFLADFTYILSYNYFGELFIFIKCLA